MDEDWPHYHRDDCYFCGDHGTVLQEHHIVPKRHGGSDEPENLVKVCPTCHQKLEFLYNKEFYKRLGIKELDKSGIDESSDDFKQRTPIEVLNGVGHERAEELYKADIHSIGDLENADPTQVSDSTALSETIVSSLIDKAENWEGVSATAVKGISKERKEKLERAGVSTVRDLAVVDPERLADRTAFSTSQIEKWSGRAKLEMY